MTDAERIARLKRMMAENIPGHGFWDVAWLVEKIEASLICGAVYESKEWPHRVVCVMAPGHTESPTSTWNDENHRGHPDSEAWEWRGDG